MPMFFTRAARREACHSIWRDSLSAFLPLVLTAHLLAPGLARAQDKAFAPLDKLLTKASYFQMLPYGTDYKPGGLVVVCAGEPKYKPLPRGVKYPEQSERQAVFPSGGSKANTTLGGLAAFLSNAMKLKFSGVSDKAIDIQQINAVSEYIAYENEALENKAVQAEVNADMTLGLCRVFVVTSVLTTKVLEITSSMALGGAIQTNGSDVPECKRSDYSAKSSSATDDKGTSSKPDNTVATSKTDTAKTSQKLAKGKPEDKIPSVTDLPKLASVKKDDKAKSNEAGSTAEGPAITYGIYGCRATANKLTLASDVPVAFALQMNEIRITSGKMRVDATPADPASVKLKHPVAIQPTTDFRGVA